MRLPTDSVPDCESGENTQLAKFAVTRSMEPGQPSIATALHFVLSVLDPLKYTETRQFNGRWKLWKQDVQSHGQSLVMLPGDAKADTARSRPRTLSKLRSDL